MYDIGNHNRRTKYKMAVQVELDDASDRMLYLFVAPGTRIVDMLNDDRQFLPFEAADSSIIIIKKTAIRRVIPLEGVTKSLSLDPYDILDIDTEATEEEIHAAYRRAIAASHPDRVHSMGLPREFLELANRRASLINDAYTRIRKERGIIA